MYLQYVLLYYTIRYVNKYISVQDRDYRALTLFGQIYTATGHVIRALHYFKRYMYAGGEFELAIALN